MGYNFETVRECFWCYRKGIVAYASDRDDAICHGVYSEWHPNRKNVIIRWFGLFLQYSDLLVENREIFIPHLYLASVQGVTPSEFREDV